MARTRRKTVTLDPSFTRILCIPAHPDDNEFTIAGSVARWAREGRDVVFCLVTTGGSGTNEHTPDNTGLIPIRERESWDAAKILGVKDVVFLGYQDGEVEPTIALRRDLTRVIRRVKPHVVVCGDPTMRWYGSNYLNHPDHRAVASAALDAVFPSSETRVIFQELLAEGLDSSKFEVVWTTDSRAAEEMLQKRQFDVVLTDVRMGHLNGFELCSRLTQRHRGLPVVVMTAFGSIDAAVNAMRAGAYDFLTKPLDLELAGVTLERAIRHGALHREVTELRRVVAASRSYGELLGASPAMRAIVKTSSPRARSRQSARMRSSAA